MANEASPGGLGLGVALWRQRWLVLGVVVAVTAMGYLASQVREPVYAADARILLAEPAEMTVFANADDRNPERRLLNSVERLQATDVMQRASFLLSDGTTASDIAEHVTATAAPERDVIRVRATAGDASRAAEIATAVANAYEDVLAADRMRRATEAGEQLEGLITSLQASIDDADAQLAEIRASVAASVEAGVVVSPEERARTIEQLLAADPRYATLQAERNAAFAELTSLRTRTEQMAVDAAVASAGIAVIEPAEPPAAPAVPRPRRDTAIAFVVAVLAAAGIGWWREERNWRLRTPADVEEVLDAPLLGELPKSRLFRRSLVPVSTTPKSDVAEAFRIMRAGVRSQVGGGTGTIAVTSPRSGDGKTIVAANLAVAAALPDQRVTLVDANARARGLTEHARATDAAGLVDLGAASYDPNECLRDVPLAEERRLALLPLGTVPSDPAAFLASDRFKVAMRRARVGAHWVVVDLPSTATYADAMVAAREADGIVLVVSRDTPGEALVLTQKRLELAATPVLGFVFNRRRRRRLRAPRLLTRLRSSRPDLVTTSRAPDEEEPSRQRRSRLARFDANSN